MSVFWLGAYEGLEMNADARYGNGFVWLGAYEGLEMNADARYVGSGAGAAAVALLLLLGSGSPNPASAESQERDSEAVDSMGAQSSGGGGGSTGGGGGGGGGGSGGDGGQLLMTLIVGLIALALWSDSRESSKREEEVLSRPETSMVAEARRLFTAREFLHADSVFGNALRVAKYPETVRTQRDELYAKHLVAVPADRQWSSELSLVRHRYLRVYAERPIELAAGDDRITADAASGELFRVHSPVIRLRSLDARPQSAVIIITTLEHPDHKVLIRDPLSSVFARVDIVIATPYGSNRATMPAALDQFAMEFISVIPGDFMMGCSDDDTDCEPNEKPVHSVHIESTFEIGRYEVTQAQWESVMGANPSRFKDAGLPVESVSWNEVNAFIRKLNERQDGYQYRLPTEPEWEYAARGGTTGGYWGPDAMDWYEPNDFWELGSVPRQATRAVGRKQPNPWGLYDTLGNVWEWTQTPWVNGYSRSPEPDASDREPGRVLRGGACYNGRTKCATRVSQRIGNGESQRNIQMGFRLVREASPTGNLGAHPIWGMAGYVLRIVDLGVPHDFGVRLYYCEAGFSAPTAVKVIPVGEEFVSEKPVVRLGTGEYVDASGNRAEKSGPLRIKFTKDNTLIVNAPSMENETFHKGGPGTSYGCSDIL